MSGSSGCLMLVCLLNLISAALFVWFKEHKLNNNQFARANNVANSYSRSYSSYINKPILLEREEELKQS